MIAAWVSQRRLRQERRERGRGNRRLGGACSFRKQLTLTEEEDHRIVGQCEVLVVRRIEPVAGRDSVLSPLCFCSSACTTGKMTSSGSVPGLNRVSKVTGARLDRS